MLQGGRKDFIEMLLKKEALCSRSGLQLQVNTEVMGD